MRPFPLTVFVGEYHGWKLFWLEVLGWGRMFCKHPPKQMTDDLAARAVEDFILG